MARHAHIYRLGWRVLAWTLLILNAIAIVLFWTHTSGFSILGLGRIAGLLLEYGLLIQLLLVSRMPWIERLFGFDALNRLHRWLGYSLVMLLVAHPLFVSIGYGSFTRVVSRWEDVFNALIGTILLVGVISVSVPWVRHRIGYGAWYATHLATYVAVLLAFGHQDIGHDLRNHAFFTYWMAVNMSVFGAFLLFRVLRPLWFFLRHRFTVRRVFQESSDIWSVSIGGRHMHTFRFRAGQFANVLFGARHLWTPHPFSFSREYDGTEIRFTIKSEGNATRAIASLKPGTPVLLDGPLGAFTANRARTGKFLLIAGGIGVTPIRALAGELRARGADIAALYAARPGHTALLDELRAIVPTTTAFVGERMTPSGIARAVPDAAARDVFICGPESFMDAVNVVLRSLGVSAAQIHSERFVH